MITLENVSVKTGDTWIFKNISLHLESRHNYLIEGNNGVGKTMLLKVIGGQLKPREGTVHYDFIDTTLDWEAQYALRKQYVHYAPMQALHEFVNSPTLFYQQRYYVIESLPGRTVREYLGSKLQHLPALRLPESFELKELYDLELTRLSNGQVKKVGLVKQLLEGIPKILLLDYPFEGLDVRSRLELRDFLDYLVVKHGLQLILVDHEHPYLPKCLNKRVVFTGSSEIATVSRETQNETESIPQVITTEIADTGDAVVEMRNVNIQYGDRSILHNLTWRVNRGERWALTGRNGSGKTTLFSLIFADHPKAYSEQVFLFGKRRGSGESIWSIKKRINYLGPEQSHFLDFLTKQLTVEQYLKQVNTADDHFQQLITYFSLDHLLSNHVGKLSHGQLQLVLLVATFLSPKELLLLDEPFQFLDSVQKALVTHYLMQHLAADTTLILITHYEEDVAQWTHHIHNL